MPLEQRRQSFEQSGTALDEPVRKPPPLAECQLRAQPTLAEELHPIPAPLIRLRRATDGVVAPPAEARHRHAMQRSEPLAQAALAAGVGGPPLDPFEREKSCRVRDSAREHLRYAQYARPLKLAKSLGLGRERRVRGTRTDLHEHGPGGTRPRPAVAGVDAATCDGAPGFVGTGSAGELGNRSSERRECLHDSRRRWRGTDLRHLREPLGLATQEGPEAEPVVELTDCRQVRQLTPQSARARPE